MEVFNNVLDLIGNTPVVRINHLDTGPCELLIKLESQNPGASIKDRIGLKMIEDAEQAGLIRPGSTLVEGTAGNTGLGLALVAAQKGYRLVLVIPDKMSSEKISNLKAMGAEVILTRSDVAKGHPEYYQDLAKRLASEMDDAFFINQFGNPSNPIAHEEVTGPEIWRQVDGRLDAIVLGVGSSGTLTGLSRYFARVAPELELILADPEGSILCQYINEGTLSTKRTLLAAALRYCREQTEAKRVLTFAADTGNRYLSKMFNDFWMRDQGFIATDSHGDLRDLIARPYASRDTVTVGPGEPLANAYKRMKLYDVSQLPVIVDDQIVGIIDESDLLMAVAESSSRFDDPVNTAMVSELTEIDVQAPVAELMPIFVRDFVAIVKDGSKFLGLITRVDLLNYLRRKADR
jgi:cystathionine beta-synthase